MANFNGAFNGDGGASFVSSSSLPEASGEAGGVALEDWSEWAWEGGGEGCWASRT